MGSHDGRFDFFWGEDVLSLFHLRRGSSSLPSVAFATCCWERDWRTILGREEYLSLSQIGNHRFPFSEKILVVNNVSCPLEVERAARGQVESGVLSRVVFAEEEAEAALAFFGLRREDFRPGPDAQRYSGVNADWIYYNALGPLTAIYCCRSDYLLYLTGDVRLDRPVSWIERALWLMEREPRYKVANLLWNGAYAEAKRESLYKHRGFFVSGRGFSDQMFLVPLADVRSRIYHEIREDASHFPRGDVFEKRFFSAMRNRGWLRLTYMHGSYTHENL